MVDKSSHRGLQRSSVPGHGANPRAGRRTLLHALPALLLAGVLPHRAHAALDTSAIERAANDADLHSVLVWQGGRMLFEHYRRSRDKPVGDCFERAVAFGPDVLHDLRSITKSVVALLVGQAVARGEIELAAPVLDFYPPLADLRRDGREGIRISHLLDMASGLAWAETTGTYGSNANDETRLWWDPSPARYILDRPLVAAPGTLWNYNGGHTVLLAEILVQRSGRSLLDLVRADLFEPLGIAHWEWRTGAHRQPLAYAGLRLTPPDLLRLGRLLLGGGTWQGRQVLPAAWVAATLQPSLTVGKGPLRYGHHWWAGQVKHAGRSLPWIAGLGNGGQRLFVVPELDLAVVLTAGAYNSEKIGPIEGALVLQIVAALRYPPCSGRDPRQRRLYAGRVAQRLEDDAVALGQFQQGRELFVARRRIDFEAQADVGDAHRHVLCDAERAAEIAFSLDGDDHRPPGNAHRRGDDIERHAGTRHQRLQQQVTRARFAAVTTGRRMQPRVVTREPGLDAARRPVGQQRAASPTRVGRRCRRLLVARLDRRLQ